MPLADNIDNLEDLEDALTEELGEAQGYIHVVYRQWCMTNSGLVMGVESEKLRDSEEMFKQILPTVTDIFEEFFADPTHKDVKDEDQARIFREAGNKDYQEKKFKSAVKNYTKSTQYAPVGSEALALAFANRSAVLFQQKKYTSCVLDINRALDNGKYPMKNRHKLLERRLRSYLHMAKMDTWDSDMKEFVGCLEQTPDLTTAKKKNVLAELQKLIESIVQKRMKTPNARTDESCDATKNGLSGLLKVNHPNPQFPQFASCVDVKYSKNFGRYTVAKRDIRAGELILSEDPPLSALNLKVLGKYCSNCFGTADCFLPSPKGTKDVFCGNECLETAMGSFHGREAPITKYLLDSGMLRMEWFIGLRAITNKPLTFFTRENPKTFLNHDSTFGSNLKEGDKYNAHPYKALFNLVTNRESWDGPNSLFMTFCACFLLRCLKEARYFKETKNIEEDTLYIGRLLIHFNEICSLNSHEIGRFEWPEDFTEVSALAGGTAVTVGGAVEPTLVLMNHSCDNNIFRINRGRATMAFASRDIKEDEEITDNYLEMIMPMADRQESLKRRYHFLCSCTACFERWPAHTELPKGLNDVPPSQFRFALDDVRTMQGHFGRIQKLGATVAQEQKGGRHKECLARALDFIRALEETMERPHAFFVMTNKTVLATLWMLHGARGEMI